MVLAGRARDVPVLPSGSCPLLAERVALVGGSPVRHSGRHDHGGGC